MKMVWISGWAYGPPCWTQCFAPVRPQVDVLVLDPLEILSDVNRLDHVILQEAPLLLGGWSLGAMLALEWACLHPEARIPLLLASATCRFCAGPAAEYGMPPARLRALRAALKRDRAAALSAFYQDAEAGNSGLGPTSSPRTDASTGALLAGLDYLAKTDLRESVPTLRTRLILLHGGRDRVVAEQAGRDLHARAANSEFVLVEEAGHDVPFTHSNRLLACLTSCQKFAP